MHCCTRYSVSPYGINCSAIDRVCKIRYTQDDYARVLFTIELIMLKQHTLHISDELFSGLTLAQLLTLYAVVNLFSVYLIMYFVYDFMI